MTEEFPFLYYEDAGDWIARKKFPSGMTGTMVIAPVEETDRSLTFNVELYISRKRNKVPEYREVTGKDGLQPAMWALEMLERFEKESNELYEGNYYSRIEVQAVDERRWKVYERILTRRGYSVTMSERKKTLVKRLENNA